MRPLLLGGAAAIREVEQPVLIAYEPEQPTAPPDLPILAASRDDAAALVDLLKLERAIERKRWRRYETEGFHGVLYRLAVDVAEQRPVSSFKTDLEREMYFTMHPPKAKRTRQRVA